MVEGREEKARVKTMREESKKWFGKGKEVEEGGERKSIRKRVE